MSVHFFTEVLGPDGLLAAHLLADRAERVDRDGAGPGSLTDAGLHYSVVTGETVKEDMPLLWAHLHVVVPDLATEVTGERLKVSTHVPSAINVNVLNGGGEEYEPHTDSCPWTMLIFVTGKHEGGELGLNIGGMITHVSPDPGGAVLFRGDLIPHWVRPLRSAERRITIPVALYPAGVAAVRDEALDSHLYR